MSFRRKTYPEVAESLLNRLLGGVSAEAHPYPPAGATREPFSHPLERAPVAQLTALWGARNARVTLLAGFTTCRDMGPTWPYVDVDLRDLHARVLSYFDAWLK